MGDATVTAFTSVVPVQSRFLTAGQTYIVLLSSCSDVGHLVTVRDMDGHLSTPQAILLSTLPGVTLGGSTQPLRLEQSFGYASLRATSSTNWTVVDVAAFSTAGADYDLRGVSYSTLTILDQALVVSSISTAGPVTAMGIHATSTLEFEGPLFASTAAIRNAGTSPLGTNLYITGATYVQSNALFDTGGNVSTSGTLTVAGPTHFVAPVTDLSSLTIQGGWFVSAAAAVPFVAQGPVTTGYTTFVAGILSTGGLLTLSTSGQVTQAATAPETVTRAAALRILRATDAFALSTATAAPAILRPRADITVVDASYTGPTNPVVEVQQGLAAPGLRTIGLAASSWAAGTLVVTGAISSATTVALQFSSATILNPAGSLVTSSIQTGNLAAGSIVGPGGVPPLEVSADSVVASTLYLQGGLTAQGGLAIPSTLVSTAAATTGSVSTLQTGGVTLVVNSVAASTLSISSAILGPTVSSLVAPAATITTGITTLSSVATGAASPSTLQVQTLATPFSYITLASPATFQGVVASTTAAQDTTTSTLQATTVTLAAPLDYSTIGPNGPFATTSTASGLSSNTPYEFISGLGTMYDPLLIKAATSRTVNITLNNCSTVSTAYFNALFTYRNDGNATGSAGLRIVNTYGTSTILSFSANPITTIQTASLSNYLIDFNPFAGASTFYLVGPSTLQAPSTIQNASPIVAGGSAGQVRLAYNDDGRLQAWSTIGTQVVPFASTNSIVWNGSLWVAAGRTTNTLAYSYNGFEWYGLGTSIFTTAATDVAWNGVRWVATGEGTNTLAISPDGVTWTGLGATIFTGRGRCVAWNGTQFVAGGEGTNTLAVSYNGSNWTGLGTSVFTSSALDVAWGSNRWVAVGAGTTKLATSLDGITWTTTGTALGQEGEAIAWNGTTWLAGGGRGSSNTLARSTDGGTTWSNINLSNVLPVIYDITYNDGLWVAAGLRGTDTFATSADDGVTWGGTSIPGTSTLSTATAVSGRQTLPYGLSTSDLVLTAGSGGPSSLAFSQDGTTWQTANPFSSVTAVNRFAWDGADQWLATAIYGTESNYTNITTAFNWDNVSSLCTVRTSTTAARITLGNAYAYSVEAFSTPFQVSYRLGTTGVNRIVGGFSATKNLTEFDLRYAFYTNDGGNANNIQENGAFPPGMSSYIVTTSTLFQLTFDGTYIKYWADGGLIRTSVPSSISTFFMGFHFKEPSSAITSVTFGPYYATNFPLYQSPSGGTSWTGNSNVPLGYGVGVATNGFRWVATGEGSRGNTIVASSNGSNWTGLGKTIFATVGRGVAWGSNLWVAVGEGGANTIATSADGLTWTGLGSTITTSGRAVATNGSNRWVATGALPNTLLTSPDGSTWTGLGSTIFNIQGNDVAWNGSLWVAAGQGTANTLATSPDGITWTGQGTSTFVSSANAVTYGSGRWTVTGETGASSFHTFRSTDGSNWTPANSTAFTIGTAAAARRLLPGPSTTYGSATIAVGYSAAAQLMYSADGSNYRAIPNFFSSLTNTLRAVAWNGSLWVAGGQTATSAPYKVLFASYDGINWSTLTFPNFGFAETVAYGKGLWLAGGIPGPPTPIAWASSTDGFNWTEQSSNIFSNSVASFAFGGNAWVAAGATASQGLRWSGDGLNWSNVSLEAGSPSGFFAGNEVAYNGNLWVAVGDFAGIGWSKNASTWTFLATPAPFSQGTGVAYGNGRWVATGVPGGGAQSNCFAVSLDGSNWTAAGGTGVFNSRATAVTFNGQAFIATGLGTTNSLAISYDGSNWTGLGHQAFSGSPNGWAIASRIPLPIHEPEPLGITTLTYRTFTWSVTANMSLLSQTSVKKTGATAAWDARANSQEGYTTAAALSFQAAQTTAAIAIGLSENPTSTTSFTALNFSFRLTAAGGLEIWELGSLVTSVGSYLTTDVLKITYDGVRVRYYRNATILRTVTRAVGAALYLSSSFFTQNGQLNAIAFEPLYQLVTTQPALATTGYLINSNAGTNLSQANPFYLTLASNLQPGLWTVQVSLAGNISTATSFVGDFYYNSTLITSTNAITPNYPTPSTYTLTFSLTSTFTYTAGDTASLQFRATRSAGNSYLYTNYNNQTATDPRSSAAIVGTINSNAIDYLQFFHTSPSALQTSELDFRLSHTSTNVSTYFDAAAGVLMNQGLLRWPSSLNTQTVQNRYNDISTRSLTYTNALLNASDPVLKEGIRPAPLEECEYIVQGLPLVRYEFTDAYRGPLHLEDRHQLGVLATDVLARAPDLVRDCPTDLCGVSTLLTVDRQQLRFTHFGATQRLLERVSTLQERIRVLRARRGGVT